MEVQFIEIRRKTFTLKENIYAKIKTILIDWMNWENTKHRTENENVSARYNNAPTVKNQNVFSAANTN